MPNPPNPEITPATETSYRLIDFGRGRKLESFGGIVLDRTSVPAWGTQPKLPAKHWKLADFRYGESGIDSAATEAAAAKATWHPAAESLNNREEPWLFRWKSTTMRLKLAPFGHVGLFPEQIENWQWLQSLASKAEIAQASDPKSIPKRPTALNLFAYTGGSTLALAAAGFAVTHVDASKPSVQWARENAQLSGLQDAPIRWIVDNVSDFVRRECKRAKQYDVIVLDPPAFGHGVDGKRWDIGQDLDPLFEMLVEILTERSRAILLTGHNPIGDPNLGPLQKETHRLIKSRVKKLTATRSTITDEGGRMLDCGYRFAWTPH